MKTLRFMISNFSVRRICFVVFLWIVVVTTIVVVLELIKGWSSFAATFDSIKEVGLYVAIFGSFCAYEHANGKMKGIDDGRFAERKTWTAWYKKHQEQIREHNIDFEEPTASKLACPKCGGNHDLLKV